MMLASSRPDRMSTRGSSGWLGVGSSRCVGVGEFTSRKGSGWWCDDEYEDERRYSLRLNFTDRFREGDRISTGSSRGCRNRERKKAEGSVGGSECKDRVVGGGRGLILSL